MASWKVTDPCLQGMDWHHRVKTSCVSRKHSCPLWSGGDFTPNQSEVRVPSRQGAALQTVGLLMLVMEGRNPVSSSVIPSSRAAS